MKNIQDYHNKRVLVLGMAKSGSVAAKLLHRLGAKVTVNDRSNLEEDPSAQELKTLGIKIVDKGHPLSLINEDTDVVVKNPGIPYSNPLIEKAGRLQIPVITEVELASQISESPFIAITGSNGKTTTTMLTGEMMKGSGRPPIVAGNIGTVLSNVTQQATAKDIIVAELSSFQLLGVKTFHPMVSVFLNLFNAHLDYHGTVEAYGEAKANITKNQTDEDWIVYNDDDERVKYHIRNTHAKRVPFSLYKKVDGAYLDEGTLFFKGKAIAETEKFAMPKGDHNIANALAAIAVAKIFGVENTHIRHVLEGFAGVPHRLQYVMTVNERRFYNDSKATNSLATSKALSAFQDPVILLAGGLDRGNGFDDLIPFLKSVKGVLSFGETKNKIADAARSAGVKIVQTVDNVDEAVSAAYDLSKAGDVILLSPACASWDQHRSFEERGDMFIKSVHMLK